MIVVSSGMEYLPFLVIYSTSSLVLPAYFNLLTSLLNQTYKRGALKSNDKFKTQPDDETYRQE